MRSQRWAPVVCAIVGVITVLATVPLGETGLNDDWSYARTALDAARTGKLIYNGWATTMIGAQAYWGAMWIKLFGFSFVTLRLSTLPLVAGCGYLIWWLGRRSGLSVLAAMFASLAVTTSPLFVPLAASYMTDVPGLFFLLLTIAWYAKACEGGRGAVGWIVLGTLAGLLGGTIRQVIWWSPMAGLVYMAWTGRKRAGVIGVCAWMWVVSAIAAVALNGWFARQPYYVPDQAGDRLQWMISHLPHSLIDSLLLVLTLVMLLLPILAAMFLIGCARFGRILMGITIAAAIWLLLWLILGHRIDGPWLGNMLTVWGVTGTEQVAIGFKPVVLPMWVRVLITVAVVVALGQLGTLAGRSVIDRRRRRQQRDHGELEEIPSPPHALRLLGTFMLGYVPLLIVQAGVGTAIDRYLLPILPVCAIGLFHHAQKRGMKLRWSVGLIVMGVFALYAIATTHDFIAEAHARAAAAQRVIESGFGRRQVTAGFEFDAWTQLEAVGHVNDPRLVNPPGTFVKPPQWAQQGARPWFWYWRWTPALEPRFFIVRAPQAELVDSAFGPVGYRCWLPPFRREVRIQQRPNAR